MKSLKLGLCFLDEDDNIVVQKAINVTWHPNIEEDLKCLADVDMNDEVAAILASQVKIDIEKGAIRDMLKEYHGKESQ